MTDDQAENRYNGPVITMDFCPLVKKNIYARAKELTQAGGHPFLSNIERAVRELLPGAVIRWEGFSLRIHYMDAPKTIYYLS